MTADRSSSAAEGGVSRRPRRARSVTESLLAIVLVLEAIVLFFASLAAFGLKVLEPGLPAWAALPLGGGFLIVLLAASLLLRWPWGMVIGWALQAALIATGILLPPMWIVGTGFALLWIYCFTRGRRIDHSRTAPTQGEPS
jgi:hypothetical protein